MSVFSDVKPAKADVANAIGSSVIITAYLLNAFQLAQNHFAQFEGWTCLAACIIRYLRKANLSLNVGAASLTLVMEEVVRNLTQLRTETLSRENFMEGAAHGDGALMYKARATLTLGTLAALELHLKAIGKDDELDSRLLDVIRKNLSLLWLWGESALPYWFCIVKYLEMNSQKAEAEMILNKILQQIVHSNTPQQKECLPSPYHGVAEVLEAELGVDVSKLVFENFSGSSYALRPVIHMMARRNMRDSLGKLWPKITHIQFQWFEPDAMEDFFSWNVREGANRSAYPNHTQGWAELIRAAQSKTKLSEFLSEHRELVRFFVLACPHRADEVSLGVLDA